MLMEYGYLRLAPVLLPVEGSSTMSALPASPHDELDFLRRSHARYHAVLIASAAIVWIASPEGEFIEPQQAWQDYTGQAWDEHQYAKWISAIHPDDRPQVMADWTDAVTHQRPIYRTKGRIWSARHQAWRAFQTRGVPVRDDAGQIVEWVGALADVQDTLDALREGEERLGLALEGADLGFWEVDVRTGVAAWNRRHAAMQGYPEDFGPASIDDWLVRIHADDRERVAAAIDRARVSRSPFAVEHRVHRADNGALRWLALHGQYAYDEAGEPTRLRGVSLDVTDRKLLEQALLDADRRKDEFLATLAHELRNPLAPVRNAAALLNRADNSAESVAFAAGVIQRQIGQMARLLDDLLDVARISQGTLALRRAPSRLTALLNVALETVRPAIDQKRQQFTMVVPAIDPMLEVDGVRVAQVLTNLLTNAARYTDDGGQITLSVTVGDDGVTFSVSDTGIGFDPADGPHLFTMFSRGAGSTHRAPGGLGIGLALSRAIAELHGGRLEATSAGPGHGSAFALVLPRSALGAVTSELAPQATSAVSRRRIVVADDNRDAALTLSRWLQATGHSVQVAHDGPSALAQILNACPDVAILDLGMPGMTGLDVARAVRGSAHGHGIRLIALTGWGQEADRRRTHDAGFDAHLTKPVDLDELERMLAKHA